jgi:probable HAF family extracellular repeat protein
VEQLEERWCPSVSYAVKDLGTLGGTYSNAGGINAFGQVVGVSSPGYGNHAFLWTPTTANATTGTMIDLGTLGGTDSSANAINAFGQTVGLSYTASGVEHAFLWKPATPNGTTGTMFDLGTLGGTSSIAYAINASGQVVGEATTASGAEHAFLWNPASPNGTTGSMIDLGTLGGTASIARGINDAGQVVANSFGAADHAFLWQNNVATDLGSLSGGNSEAWAINAGGQVAGQADTTSGKSTQFHAFRWSPSIPNGTSGKMKDLGALNTNTTIRDSAAHGMDDFGHVVGTSGSDLPLYAVYWPGSGSLQDLNGLVAVNSGFGLLQDAKGIDNVGQIVGQGQLPSQPITHAFLLTPTTTAAVPALTSPATVSTFSVAPSSPVAAPAPLLVSAIAPSSGPTTGHKQTPASFVATRDPGLPGTLSKGRTVATDLLALKVRDRVFAAFADDVVSAPS